MYWFHVTRAQVIAVARTDSALTPPSGPMCDENGVLLNTDVQIRHTSTQLPFIQTDSTTNQKAFTDV